MSLREYFSRPLKKLGGRRRPDGSGANTTGEGVEPANSPPRPKSGVIGDKYGQGGNERSVGEGEVGSVGLSLQPEHPEPTAGEERKGEFKRAKIDVDEVEEGLVDSSLRLGGEEEPRDSRYRVRECAIVEGEVGLAEPPQSKLGISSDREPSGGT